jgi:hypothetical protein
MRSCHDDTNDIDLGKLWDKSRPWLLGAWVLGTLGASWGLGGLAVLHRYFPVLTRRMDGLNLTEFVDRYGFFWALLCCLVGLAVGTSRDERYVTADQTMDRLFTWSSWGILVALMLSRLLPRPRA